MGPERRRVDLKPLGGAEEPERTSDLSMGGSLGGLVFIDVLTLLRSDSARCSSVSILVADMIDGFGLVGSARSGQYRWIQQNANKIIQLLNRG